MKTEGANSHLQTTQEGEFNKEIQANLPNDSGSYCQKRMGEVCSLHITSVPTLFETISAIKLPTSPISPLATVQYYKYKGWRK